MTEISQFDPVSTYHLADENLKRDVDFIKHIYSLEKTFIKGSVYASMPEDLKKDESIAVLAIENNDFDSIDAGLADSPLVWEKLIDKIVEKENPDNWFSRDIGEIQVANIYLSMSTDKGGIVNLSKRLISDEIFIGKLNERYPKYRFEVDKYQQVFATKLA
jgi:hypothetical protein